jgi:spore germination cell wall hydrolase CwlJ-like protein
MQPLRVRNEARRAVSEVFSGNAKDFTNGATHFESTSFKTPYWANGMKVTLVLGKHRFYKGKT